jgi:hypothetical protein
MLCKVLCKVPESIQFPVFPWIPAVYLTKSELPYKAFSEAIEEGGSLLIGPAPLNVPKRQAWPHCFRVSNGSLKVGLLLAHSKRSQPSESLLEQPQEAFLPSGGRLLSLGLPVRLPDCLPKYVIRLSARQEGNRLASPSG